MIKNFFIGVLLSLGVLLFNVDGGYSDSNSALGEGKFGVGSNDNVRSSTIRKDANTDSSSDGSRDIANSPIKLVIFNPKPAAPKSAKPKPADSESAKPKPADSEPAKPKSADSEPAKPKSADSEPAKPKSADSEPAKPKPADSEPAKPKSVDSESAKPKPKPKPAKVPGQSLDIVPAKGLENWARDIVYKNKSYSVYVVDPKKNTVRLFNKRQSGGVYNFNLINKDLLANNKVLLFAMNAGMYDANREPIGLYIEDGKELYPINLNSHSDQPGNFYDLKPNGVFAINRLNKAFVVDSQSYSSVIKSGVIKIATQSGPLLVINGKINASFTEGSKNVNIRNGVGVDRRGNVVFVISNDPVNFFDMSTFFRDFLNCNNALYLDGVVSEMYLPKLRKNTLLDNWPHGPIITVVK